MQFFYWKFAVTSVIKIHSKMGELWMDLDYDKLDKFKSRTIIFLVKKAYCCVGQYFWKKNTIFSSLRPCYHRQANKKNLFCHWKNTSTRWRTWSLALSVHKFFSHLHFFKVGEIKLLKYGNLMLPAG